MESNKLNILLFSSLFPNAIDPVLGVFVETRMRHLLKDTDASVAVMAPVPWFPFKGKLWGSYGKFAEVPRRETRHSVAVEHPRFLVIPKIGMSLTPGFLYRAAKSALEARLKAGEKIDVIDAHYLYPDGVAAAKLGEVFGIPVVMTARGSDVTEIGRMPSPRRKILKAIKSAAHTICVSNSLRDELISFGADAAKITTLRNGVDAERFKEIRRNETRGKWRISGKVALFAGWLIERKRVDIMLDAVAKLDDVTAVIAGEGPLLGDLKAQAERLGIADRTRFLGKLVPEEMPEAFSAADVLVLPSEREGWANVLLESMACGTSVVSRAVAGALDLVTCPEAGLLVDGSDPEAYADAIQRVLASPEDREKTRRYAEKFGWREISLAQKEIFERAISGFAAPKK